jgi:toxin secretion/phage lysis holin
VIQLVFAAIGGWLGWFLGGCDGFLYALIAFVVIDYITGVMCAIVDKKLSSEVGFKGIFKKVLIFMLVGVANIIDVQVLGQAGCASHGGHLLLPVQRGRELLENAGHLGLPIPAKLKAVLEQLHDRSRKGGQVNESAQTHLLTNNDCYKAGKTITPKGIMVHSTGANNPNLKRYVGPDDGLLGVNQYGNHWNTATPGGSRSASTLSSAS